MFNRALGMSYYQFISELHEKNIFEWYMEVGCRSGASFASVRGRTIAVDPFFMINSNVIGVKPSLFIFQEKSDDFFASEFLYKNKIEISVSFLDGMHLFEYLLRDFIGAEKNSNKGGVIMLHDCVPFSKEMTTRDLDNIPRSAWTGDVWKIIPVLREYRPDLTVDVLDCKPTGLVVVSNLDPKNKNLQDKYEEIVLKMVRISISDYGIERFGSEIGIQNAASIAAAGFPMFKNAPVVKKIMTELKKITP